ncbi:MAG: hypothetical protein ACXABO_14380 [Promethearchaeota archaeon]|jgi:hypothetical protein
MRKIKWKILFFVSTFLILQLLNPGIYAVKAENDNNQEEIIILDESKINVADARHFTIGDIDGDEISEVITFKSKVKDSGAQWIINTYHKDKKIWFPVLSKIITEKVSGHIHNVDVGNFDNDNAQEIIIATRERDSSKIYLFDFDWRQNEYEIQLIYELNSCISDLEVRFNDEKSSDSIYMLFSDNTDSAEHFETNVMIINRDKKGIYNSEIIYSESKIYWSLFTIGQFVEQESHKNQILLYQHKITESIMGEAIIRIITSDGQVIMEDTNIGMHSNIRDIVAWDRNKGEADELCILDIKDMGDDIGFTSKMIYCTFNHEGLLEKEERLLDSNKILNKLCIGKLGGNDDKLLVLDPYLGSVSYATFFDEEAQALYNSIGYWQVTNAFDGFETDYANQLDIFASSSGYYYYTSYGYTSSGSTSSELYDDFVNDVGDPSNYGDAHIAIGVIYDYYDDHPNWDALGRGGRNERYSIILTRYWAPMDITIDHEVGHNYGLYSLSQWHCPKGWCIMDDDIWWNTEFCGTCVSRVDPAEFAGPPGSPPPGGGCPILYTYNGTEYIEEGLLDIHDIDGIDRTYIHFLLTAPYPLNNKILLRLTEHPQTFSDIDQVRLYGKLENGLWVSLHLKSAFHSSIGEVGNLLQYSDDLRVTELGADYNNGVSDSIDLEFATESDANFLEFQFIIEGNNVIIKP